MHPIFDTAMLKHHRVDYAPRIDRDGARRPAIPSRAALLLITAVIAMIPIGLLSRLVA